MTTLFPSYEEVSAWLVNATGYDGIMNCLSDCDYNRVTSNHGFESMVRSLMQRGLIAQSGTAEDWKPYIATLVSLVCAYGKNT